MDVDLNLVRSVVTVVSLLAFVGIVAWAWSAQRKAEFDAVARDLLKDEEGEAAAPPKAQAVDVSQLQCAAWAGSVQAGRPKAATHHHSTAFKAGYGSMS